MLKIYHNSRCSKSRATLALLEASDREFEIINYLDNPPSAEEIKLICAKLNLKPKDIVRTGEDQYKKLGEIADAAWPDVISQNPILMQRPIVVGENEAIIGRPPENVEKLLG